MYQSYWGLTKPPLPSGLDRHLFYEGASQRESLARLRFLLANHRRLGLVVGDVGLGKSLLLEVFAEQSRAAGHAVAQVETLGLSTREFYWRLGTELQARVQVDDDVVRLFRQINDRLHENVLQGRQTVILLDDLDQAGVDLQNHVQRLLRTDAANSGIVTVVGSVSHSHVTRLAKPLLQLCDLRIELQPWDELDTVGYLQMALFEAGAERPLFDDDAIAELHRIAEGSLHAVNRIADFALLAGSSIGLDTIDVETIRQASESITLTSLV